MNVAGVLSAKNVEMCCWVLATRLRMIRLPHHMVARLTMMQMKTDPGNYLEIRKNKSGKIPGSDNYLCSRYRLAVLGSNGKWYKSQDAGLTWKHDKMVLPASLLLMPFCFLP